MEIRDTQQDSNLRINVTRGRSTKAGTRIGTTLLYTTSSSVVPLRQSWSRGSVFDAISAYPDRRSRFTVLQLTDGAVRTDHAYAFHDHIPRAFDDAAAMAHMCA